jgi:type VI protein secretion system component Hcp
MSEDRKPEEIKNEPLPESNLNKVVGGTPNTTNTTAGNGHVSVNDLHVTKLVDKSSPKL